MKNLTKQVLGRAAQVNLPEFGVSGLPAKVDTGAYSSSIDCSKVVELEKNGQKVLEFTLFHPDNPLYSGAILATSDYTTTEVTSSHGVSQRFVLYTDIELNGRVVRSRITLTNRKGLRYPLLLGRQFLTKQFLVDVDLGTGLPGDEEERNL
ncbi:MAG TPA: RimK/LysX family protein [Candidatus Saccharimonadales bacterium]